MPPLQLTDARQLKTLIVDPVIAALRLEMRESIEPLVAELHDLRDKARQSAARLNQLEIRVSAVEKFKLKIAAVCSAIAVLAGIAWRMALDWIKGRVGRF